MNSETERPHSSKGFRSDFESHFVIFGWGVGGIFPVAGTIIYLMWNWIIFDGDDTHGHAAKEIAKPIVIFSIASVLYIVLSFAFIVAHYHNIIFRKGKSKGIFLGLGGVVSICYLFIAIPLSGGLNYSPLAFSLIFLPTVVSWYLSTKLHSAVFSILCFVAFSGILITPFPSLVDNALDQWWVGPLGRNAEGESFLRAGIAFLQIFSAWLFGFHRPVSIEEGS